MFSRQQNLIKFTLEFQECNTDVTAINASEIGVYDAHHKGMANLPPITVWTIYFSGFMFLAVTTSLITPK